MGQAQTDEFVYFRCAQNDPQYSTDHKRTRVRVTQWASKLLIRQPADGSMMFSKQAPRPGTHIGALCDRNGQSCTFSPSRPPKAWTAPMISATLRGWKGCSPCRSHRLRRHAKRGSALRKVVPCQICSATRSCLPRRLGHQCSSSGRTNHRARLRGHHSQNSSLRPSPLVRRSHPRATQPG